MYPYVLMGAKQHRREFSAELAHAGEARHFIAWTGAAAGLRGGSLSDLAVAAEALLTDIFLSVEIGETLVVESEATEDTVRTIVRHPELRERRMSGLETIMEQFLDGYEISPDKAVMIKRLG
ncbi:MAG: hypothetical protein AVDCRST_MAG37-1093 [uncultured Rubrobacteraceae bacterium]|uniref:Uncharacterized protein n=1 Tax=uncultured Rubrobacteraceae bacterium TaxID=349277 RepID=A0A6J4Q8G8_9ACTN|nr:MAG: hypothetical protein AVDCRST_MAG37-1093 [uncultured Rubrobacteraceae bacterium]